MLSIKYLPAYQQDPENQLVPEDLGVLLDRANLPLEENPVRNEKIEDVSTCISTSHSMILILIPHGDKVGD